MLQTAQRAFGISSERHYRLLHATTEEKPRVIVLSIVVQEAEGLEAKDANGKKNLFHFVISCQKYLHCLPYLLKDLN